MSKLCLIVSLAMSALPVLAQVAPGDAANTVDHVAPYLNFGAVGMLSGAVAYLYRDTRNLLREMHAREDKLREYYSQFVADTLDRLERLKP